MCMKTLRKFIKLIAFTLILIMALDVVTNVMVDKGSVGKADQYQTRAKEFYDEIPGTLDAVYLGASNVYAYWQAPIAWNLNGIAVFPFSTGSQPTPAIPFLIEEVKKTQPQALIIVNLNQIVVTGAKMGSIHWLTDPIPLSRNKIDLVYSLYEGGDGADAPDPLEYIFPLIRFHTRWNELTERDINYNRTDGLKGACYFSDFFKKKVDLSENYQKVDLSKKEPLSRYGQAALENILDYCDANETNILFVIVPQFTGVESRTAQYNSAQEYVESRGYTVLNLMQPDKLGIDVTQDYCASTGKHLNIQGAFKFTKYLSDYLVDHYGFKNKRGGVNPLYTSWEEAGALYQKLIEPYLTEAEGE